MSTFVRSSLKKLAILTAILVAISLLIFVIKPEWIHPAIPLIFLLFVGLSVGATFIASGAEKQDPQMATNFYLGIMTGRLILSVIVLVIVLLIDKSQQILFVINFFALYLCYAVFDITGLVANLRTDFREH